MPTPAEHYETAENYLDQADKAADPLHAQRLAMRASVHATLASVPWARDDVDEVAAGLDRDEVAALLEVVDVLWSWQARQPVVPDDDQPGYAEGHVMGERAAKVAIRDLIAPVRPLLDRQ